MVERARRYRELDTLSSETRIETQDSTETSSAKFPISAQLELGGPQVDLGQLVALRWPRPSRSFGKAEKSLVPHAPPPSSVSPLEPGTLSQERRGESRDSENGELTSRTHIRFCPAGLGSEPGTSTQLVDNLRFPA